MNRRHRLNGLALCGLFAIAGIEIGCSFVPMGRTLRPVLLLPAIAMVALVALVFMRVATGPTLVRCFAIASLFWLTVLLGLGMMDPLTRAVFAVHGAERP